MPRLAVLLALASLGGCVEQPLLDPMQIAPPSPTDDATPTPDSMIATQDAGRVDAGIIAVDVGVRPPDLGSMIDPDAGSIAGASPMPDAMLIPDTPPPPGPIVCGDPVGQWRQLGDCVQAFNPAPTRLNTCPTPGRASPPRIERQSTLDVLADGTFSLTCQHDEEFSTWISNTCNDDAPSCEDAIGDLEWVPSLQSCSDLQADSCGCHLVNRQVSRVEGAWAINDAQVMLQWGDEAIALPCRRRGPPIAAWSPAACGQVRPIALPMPRPRGWGRSVHIAQVEGGFAVAWRESLSLWRAKLDADGEVIEVPQVLADRHSDPAQLGEDLFWMQREDDREAGVCDLMHHDGQRTRALAVGIECLTNLAVARGPAGFVVAGLNRARLWQIAAGAVQRLLPDAEDLWSSPAIAWADDALAVLIDGVITKGPEPLPQPRVRGRAEALRWDRERQTVYGVQVDNVDNRGALHVIIRPQDGPEMNRVLLEATGDWGRGADIHAEGDGYRVFWGDVRPTAEGDDYSTSEIYTWRLDADGTPRGVPQRLTDVPLGTASHPFVFPTAQGYTMIYAADRGHWRPTQWEIMHVDHACLD